jgi:valyl-tRNA synthetase
MEVLKAWTVAARNLRSEAKIPPAEKLPLYATGSPAVADVEAVLAAVQALARLSEVKTMQTLPDSSAPVAVVGGARIMLYKEVDPAAERSRLSKESARLEAEIARERARLQNPSFVERAPAPVVEEAKNRLASSEATLARVTEQLAKLSSR